MSCHTSTCPSQSGPAPIPMVGTRRAAVTSAATDRFLAYLRVDDDPDWEGACGYVLDPETGTPPEGERQQACADGAREAMSAYEQLLAPGVFDSFDASMVRAEPAEDGTIALSLLEQDVDVPMVRGEDGQWYLSIPF
jgi:hypothetical protein